MSEDFELIVIAHQPLAAPITGEGCQGMEDNNNIV